MSAGQVQYAYFIDISKIWIFVFLLCFTKCIEDRKLDSIDSNALILLPAHI